MTVTLEPWYLCERLPFNFGCVVKYLCRAAYKGQEASDLEKALAYLRRCAQHYLMTRLDPDMPRHEWLGDVPEQLEAFCRQFPELGLLFDEEGQTSLEAISATMRALTRRLGTLEREGNL